MFKSHPLSLALLALLAISQNLSAADLSVSIDALHSDDFEARRSALTQLESTVAHASEGTFDAGERKALESTLLGAITDVQTPALTQAYLMRLLPPIASDATVDAMVQITLASASDAAQRDEAAGVLAQVHGTQTTAAIVAALERAPESAQPALWSALAVRRDASQSAQLVRLLKQGKLTPSDLAIQSLGSIANSDVRDYLFDSWKSASGDQQASLAAALLNSELARPKELQALALDSEHAALQVAAFRQWLKLDEVAALALLQSTLDTASSHADVMLDVALQVGREATWQAVLDRTESLSESSLCVVLTAVGEQARTDLEPWVLQLLPGASEAVELTAVDALGLMGGSASTDALIARLSAKSDALAAAAMRSLAVVHDPELDDRILATAGMLSNPDHLRALELLSVRNCVGAVQLLNSLLSEQELEAPTRAVVLTGLERVGNLESAKLLLLKLVTEPNASQVRNLQIAIKRLVIRLEQPDRLWSEAFAPVLHFGMPPVLEARVLAILDGISAEPALEYCIDRHSSADPLLARAAEQALIRWRRVDVSDYWVSLLQNPYADSASKALALRSLGMNLKSQTLADTERQVATKAAALFVACTDPAGREQILQAVAGFEDWHQQNFYRALQPSISVLDYLDALAPFAPR